MEQAAETALFRGLLYKYLSVRLKCCKFTDTQKAF
jgi:hypothetical protein